MEIALEINRSTHFVRGALAGEMEYEHLHGILSALVAHRILDHKRLYDAREMRPRFTVYDIQMLRVRLAPLRKTTRIAPTAIVVPQNAEFAVLRVWELLMTDVYTIHPCHSMQEAEDWLEDYTARPPLTCEAA